jgi:hypothetical protein
VAGPQGDAAADHDDLARADRAVGVHHLGRIADRFEPSGQHVASGRLDYRGRAISGATAGYFIGSTVALLRQYFRKRAMDAGT